MIKKFCVLLLIYFVQTMPMIEDDKVLEPMIIEKINTRCLLNLGQKPTEIRVDSPFAYWSIRNYLVLVGKTTWFHYCELPHPEGNIRNYNENLDKVYALLKKRGVETTFISKKKGFLVAKYSGWKPRIDIND